MRVCNPHKHPRPTNQGLMIAEKETRRRFGWASCIMLNALPLLQQQKEKGKNDGFLLSSSLSLRDITCVCQSMQSHRTKNQRTISASSHPLNHGQSRQDLVIDCSKVKIPVITASSEIKSLQLQTVLGGWKEHTPSSPFMSEPPTV